MTRDAEVEKLMGEGTKHTCVLAPTDTGMPACTQGPHSQRHKDTHCPLCFQHANMHTVGRDVCVLAQGHAPCTCLSQAEMWAHANENVYVHSPKDASSESGVGEMKMKRTQSLSPRG